MKNVLEILIQMQELIKSSPELFHDGIDQDLSDMISNCIKIINRK